MKIKHSVSCPPTKYRGTFLLKKLCMGEQKFWGKFMGAVLHGDWWSDHARRGVNGLEVSKVESS